MEEVLHCVLCISQAMEGLIPHPTEAAKKKREFREEYLDKKAAFTKKWYKRKGKHNDEAQVTPILEELGFTGGGGDANGEGGASDGGDVYVFDSGDVQMGIKVLEGGSTSKGSISSDKRTTRQLHRVERG
ncbi:unnamed protein product [Ilex paraguariensis]|uniref:Uncharacterized protein n=1 Tax=Ilex paraguariensis TaxID=185542 RepID=A0ABC8RN40_9AQUA